jgi:hypothetical protein
MEQGHELLVQLSYAEIASGTNFSLRRSHAKELYVPIQTSLDADEENLSS